MKTDLKNMTQEIWNSMSVLERDAVRSTAGLTKQLIGLEGARVEVVDSYGDKRRFWVSRSTGWVPCHIEVKRRTSTGGVGTYGAPFKSITVLNRKGI